MPASVRAEVQRVPFGTVSIHTEGGALHGQLLAANGAGVVQWPTSAAESACVQVEARHPDNAHRSRLRTTALWPGP